MTQPSCQALLPCSDYNILRSRMEPGHRHHRSGQAAARRPRTTADLSRGNDSRTTAIAAEVLSLVSQVDRPDVVELPC
eukprot:SAG31_NODE_22909_length_515_cov_1.367788_1_plen_77_part_10